MESVIAAVLSNLFILLFVVALVVAGFKARNVQLRRQKFDIFFAEVVFYGIGVVGMWAFISHAIGSAAHIGWPPSPFEWELAFATLGVAIVALMQLWTGRPYRIAAAIVMVVFSWGAAIQHINQIRCCHNYAPGNAGPILYWDIILPIVLIWLAIGSRPVPSSNQ